MEVKVRYLGHVIAKSFGSSKKVETMNLPGKAKYRDVLNILEDKLRRHGEKDGKLLETFVLLCEGRVLHRIRDEPLESNCKVLVGYADFGG